MIRVIIRRSMKEGDTVIVTGNDVIKGVVEFQWGVQAIAGTFKKPHIGQLSILMPDPNISTLLE